MLDVLVREASDNGSRRTRLSSPRARKSRPPNNIDDRSFASTTRRGKMASARICGIPDAFAAKKPRQV
jgi:hypothetical protein